MSFRVPGHLSRLLIQEGDRVEQGQVLAELKQTVFVARCDQAKAQLAELNARRESLELAIKIKEDSVEAQIRQAQAMVSAAEARYESLKTGSRTGEIREAAAALEKARAELDNRRQDYQRMQTLFERRIISASQMEDSRTAHDAALAVYKAAEEKYKLVSDGPRQEMVKEGQANVFGTDAALETAKIGRREAQKMRLDLGALQAQIDQAAAALAIAQDDLNESRLRAPFNGFVSVKNVEEGEYVQAGAPVFTLARLDRLWVKTYIPETYLGKIRIGGEAQVISDTFPAKVYVGHVSYISQEAEFTPKNVQTHEERTKLVYRIKVMLDNPNQELKAGMPVDVLLR
ncbi:HlyD family efflux transporter periplasmic adaptor subunit [Desulfosarcina sp.]|uniref:HlyD family efflux transporter periplasmic adaptor subunit n=1 Tax=Desulfosarcina sp. TaxID=2027861 RepID=UPI003970D730